jgi:redox-sensitive bicupin YhaK (pirin superfamily)
MFLVDINAQAKESIDRPNSEQECLIYLAHGEVIINEQLITAGETLLLDADDHIETQAYSRIILLGGEAWDEVPHLVWNFVSFDPQRIEQAKLDWMEGKFPSVTGDQEEFIPLPD